MMHVLPKRIIGSGSLDRECWSDHREPRISSLLLMVALVWGSRQLPPCRGNLVRRSSFVPNGKSL
jgi:hypothetical protein